MGFARERVNACVKTSTHKSLTCTTRIFCFPLGGGATALAGLGLANQVERSSVRSLGGG